MLSVRAPKDDRAVDLVLAEAEPAQQVVGEQLEPVAVVAVAAEGLLQGGPAIDRTVGDVVVLRDVLDPGRDFARLRAPPLGEELVELRAQALVRRLRRGLPSPRAGHRSRRVQLGICGGPPSLAFGSLRAAFGGLLGAGVALALLPLRDLAAPGVALARGREVAVGG